MRYKSYYSWIPSTLYYQPFEEHVYYLAQKTIPLPVFNKNISQSSSVFWKHADIIANTSGSYLYTEMNEVRYANGSVSKSFKVINVTALSRQQAIFNNDYNGTYTSETENGEVKVCPPGCIDCNCTGCHPSYTLDALTSSCKKCGPGCASCDASDTTACTSCETGLYFDSNSSSCRTCALTCLSCGTTANTCSVCYPGWTFVSGECIKCPTNCFNCTSNSSCN